MRTTAIIALLLAGLSTSARAELEAEVKETYRSPQRFLFEMKFGPYAPQIDSEFDGPDRPFAHIFGEGQALMMSWEFDVELWRRFGTVAVGASLGYYSNSAKAYEDTSADGLSPSTSDSLSSSDTSISLLPLAILGIYRFDLLAERWRVPVVPFVKFGFNYTIWWIDQSNGEQPTFDGHTGRGGTFGWEFHAGGAFLLDVLEPQAAKTLDVEMGINHTYLFFEFALVRADGFGAEKALRVGDTTWYGGIAFEF